MIKEKRISKALIPGTTTVGEGAPAFDLMRGREGTCCCRRQGIEQMVCLGDALQGGSHLARLRDLNCPVVMGNADAWLVTSQQQREVQDWSLAHLSQSDVAFIQQFRSTIEIPLEAEKTLLCFHGSPRSFDEIILPQTPDDVVWQFLGGYDATLLCGGHTHTQQMRRLGTSWYFNPGSVSLAYTPPLLPPGLP